MAKFSQKKKEKIFEWNLTTLLWKEKGRNFCQFLELVSRFAKLSPKKKKKEKTEMECRGRSKSQIAMCEVVGSKLYSQGFFG